MKIAWASAVRWSSWPRRSGGALASAQPPTPSPVPTATRAGWGGERGGMAGMRNGAGYGATANAADLAATLGVSQDAVSAALAKYHAANLVTVRGAGLTAEQKAAEHEKLATFLAGELKVDRVTVLQALTTRQEIRQADRTAQLKTSLDQAVKDGRLTRAQADAIIAAHASGAMGGGMGRGRAWAAEPHQWACRPTRFGGRLAGHRARLRSR